MYLYCKLIETGAVFSLCLCSTEQPGCVHTDCGSKRLSLDQQTSGNGALEIACAQCFEVVAQALKPTSAQPEPQCPRAVYTALRGVLAQALPIPGYQPRLRGCLIETVQMNPLGCCL